MGGIIKNLILHFIVVMLGVSIMTFVLGRLAPGDPALTLLENGDVIPTQEAIAEARDYLGLDEPIAIQYLKWAKKAVIGDFGLSYKTGQPALKEIGIRLPATIELAFTSFAFLIVISLTLGVMAAWKNGKIAGMGANLINTVLLSLPSFCIAILLILVFSVKLKLLPAIGRGTFAQILLPSVTLGLGLSAPFIRFIKTQMLEELEKDYVYNAKGMGVSSSRIILNVLWNVRLPIITNMGITAGALLGGSAIVESIFAWPGAGSYLVEAIMARDYPVIQCYAVLMAGIYILVNGAIDFLHEREAGTWT